MNIYSVLSVGIIGVMLSAGCAGSKEVRQEDRTVYEQIQQRDELHDARFEVLKGLEDEELGRALYGQEMSNFRWMMDVFVFYAGIEKVEYTQPEFFHLNQYSDRDAMTEAYLQSLVAVNSWDHDACMRYSNEQGFTLNPGFEFPFRYWLTYTDMVLDNGDTLSFSSTANGEPGSGDIIDMRKEFCFAEARSEKSPRPVAVKGEFYAELPEQIVNFELSAEDAGNTLEKEGFLVKVLEFSEDYYVVEISIEDGTDPAKLFKNEDILAEAVTDGGDYLASRATQREPMSEVYQENDLLEEAIAKAKKGNVDLEAVKKEFEAWQKDVKEVRAGKIYLARAFNGQVDKGLLTLMVYGEESQKVERKLELAVLDAPYSRTYQIDLDELPELETTAPVYNDRLPVTASRAELTEQEIADSMALLHFPGYEFEKQKQQGIEPTGVINWFYPNVQSDVFIESGNRVAASAMAGHKFFDENNEPVQDAAEVELKKSGNLKNTDLGNIEFAYDFKAHSIEYYPERFTAKPVRFKAALPVLIAPNLTKESYAKDELPQGVSLNGNRLIIDYAEFEPRETIKRKAYEQERRRNEVFVKDSKGYLKEIKRQSLLFAHGRNEPPVDVYYFYGEPETFEIWYTGDVKMVDYKVDIDLSSIGTQSPK